MNLQWWLLFLQLALASPGDRLTRFGKCVDQCISVNCYQEGTSHWHFQAFNPTLKWLWWDCHQDCDYQCQRIISFERQQRHKEVYQFHGKWPFLRVFGIQEFSSTIFSLGNLLPHLYGSFKLHNAFISTSDPQTKTQLVVLLMSNIITCLAWLFSTIYHIRDFEVTEKLDYFLAGATVMSGFYTFNVRNWQLYRPQNQTKFWMFSIFVISVYLAHITRLIVDWSYTYNMRFNILFAVLQNFLLVRLCYNLYLKYYDASPNKNPSNIHVKYCHRLILPSFFNKSDKLFSLYPLVLSAIVIMGMSLEVFDFPPFFYDLIDAHSLWHLVTIFPIVFGWYDWLIWDVLENVPQIDTKRD